jgi:hypothetical protein
VSICWGVAMAPAPPSSATAGWANLDANPAMAGLLGGRDPMSCQSMDIRQCVMAKKQARHPPAVVDSQARGAVCSNDPWQWWHDGWRRSARRLDVVSDDTWQWRPGSGGVSCGSNVFDTLDGLCGTISQQNSRPVSKSRLEWRPKVNSALV